MNYRLYVYNLHAIISNMILLPLLYRISSFSCYDLCMVTLSGQVVAVICHHAIAFKRLHFVMNCIVPMFDIYNEIR